VVSDQGSLVSVQSLIFFDEVKLLNEGSFFDYFQKFIRIDRVITLFYIESKISYFWADLLSPIENKSIDFFFNLTVVKYRETQLIPKVIFHVSEYQLGAGKNSLEGLFDGGVFFDSHFFVEGNDGSEGSFFG
jgi:hypothetical protein